MIVFRVTNESIMLDYKPEDQGGAWLVSQLKLGNARLSKVFYVTKDDLAGDLQEWDDDSFADQSFSFRIASKDGAYFRIPGRIFNIDKDVLIAPADIELKRKTFAAERDISIMRRLARFYAPGAPIKLGGPDEDAIPAALYETMLKRFPNTMEVNRYAEARVATILEGFLDPLKDVRREYEDYLSKRGSVLGADALPQIELLQSEIAKFEYVRNVIAGLLSSGHNRSEADWQRLIVPLLLLIFPKYIAVLEKVRIEDHYYAPGDRTRREIDVALVDANGNLDIIEIKKPFVNAILARAEYRNNFIPAKELGGTIMQAEKYLFHLAKWGVDGERRITQRYASKLPTDFTINITSRKAIILIGRDQAVGSSAALSARQLLDFEIIKRKYANMVDIMTYDDLLRRLDRIIASLKKRAAGENDDDV